jgi:ATP-dependent DNA ligase
LSPGLIPFCLPTKALQPPSGDGFRVIAHKDGDRVRLYSRPGNDLTYRFPLIVEALARLCSRSCIIDGEAVSSARPLRSLVTRCRTRTPTADQLENFRRTVDRPLPIHD